MSLKHEFNRVAHLLNDGVGKAEKRAATLVGRAEKHVTKVNRQARRNMETGRKNAVSLEEAIVRHARKNPALYIVGGALLVGVLIARTLLRPQPRVELEGPLF